MAEHHIYFTRHGWSEWNEANKICGVTDIPLTEKGRAQARELGQKCLDEKLDFDTILASPLKRAYETAEIVAEMTGKPLLTEPRLIEQNFGRFEGTPRDGEEFKKMKEVFTYRYDGGESMMMMAQRIYNLLDDLKTRNHTYLLVAHNGISRVVNSYFHEMTNEEYAAFGIKNCGILRFDF